MKAFSRIGNEDGNILVTVVLVSMLVGSLTALTLTTGEQANTSSTRDRNHEVALGVAEAGLHEAISNIESTATLGTYVNSFDIPAADGEWTTTPQGTYRVEVERTIQGFIIDAWGRAGGSSLGRTRHVKATLTPPPMFPEGKYALFSFTSIELKNNDTVTDGDVWANNSITVDNGVTVDGDVTSAQSWINHNGSRIEGNVWSGGRNLTGGWAITTSGSIGGWVKASVSSPACTGEDPLDYDVTLGALVDGDATSFGTVTGPVGGSVQTLCTPAAPAKAVPPFTFNRSNYDDPDDPDDYREFSSVAAFQSFLTTNGDNLEGVFVIDDPAPTLDNSLDLSNVTLSGDTMIITNTRVFSINPGADESLSDGEKAIFVLVSRFDPPISSSCGVNNDGAAAGCAVYFQNNFQPDCDMAVLIYADNGPVAIKNGSAMCGSIVSDAIMIKNNQNLTYDARVESLLGFGPNTYKISRWEELRPT